MTKEIFEQPSDVYVTFTDTKKDPAHLHADKMSLEDDGKIRFWIRCCVAGEFTAAKVTSWWIDPGHTMMSQGVSTKDVYSILDGQPNITYAVAKPQS